MTQPSNPSTPQPTDQGNRSDGLLPADQNDPNLQVAEEVAFDLQSDEARRVGAMPQDSDQAKPAQAIAETLRPKGNGKT